MLSKKEIDQTYEDQKNLGPNFETFQQDNQIDFTELKRKPQWNKGLDPVPSASLNNPCEPCEKG